ncbi:MAG TPA: CHAT domain-containing protein [Longimicrobium sp.]|nr:CHAT domain-containing protein [Longimicrobium sp.]
MGDKIKVLFLAADPFRNGARLELGEEMRAIEHAIQQGSARDSLEFVSHFATRSGDLQYALLKHEPQIVHFSGHGDRGGMLYLGDEHGGRREVDRAALGKLFGALEGGVRVVVLNGCHTLPVAAVLSRIVDYAIGSRDRLTDETSIRFSEAFYSALAFGKDVRQAFELAVSQLQVDGSREADVPVLRVRPGAAPDPLLAVPARRPAPAVAGAEEVVQNADLGEVDVDVGNMIAADLQGPAAVPRRVDQTLRSQLVRARELNLTTLRIRGPDHE